MEAELDPERYHILREAGTEAPFSGSLLQVDDEGAYLCGACRSAALSSGEKFESHCGWPSFTRPEEQENVRLLDDNSHGMHRIEVRCKRCDSHLGHVFDDGPGPEGTRYCINSRSLDFRPSRSSECADRCHGRPRAAVPGTVTVLYAGSLVTPMEGPVKAASRSKASISKVSRRRSKSAGAPHCRRHPLSDVFISVDPALVVQLGSLVASATTFAGTSLGVAWTPTRDTLHSSIAPQDGGTPLEDALETPGLRIGRTDPLLDPKGQYTIEGVTMWLGVDGARQLLGPDENPSQIFPEQDLARPRRYGPSDVGFFYRTEAVARGYRFVPLPGKAALTDRITYTLAIMKARRNPRQAKAFSDFILSGPGRAILERAASPIAAHRGIHNDGQAQFPHEQAADGSFERQRTPFATGLLLTAVRATPRRPGATTSMFHWPVLGRTERSSCANSRAWKRRLG